ncbi:MAG: M23 family metallopeptidase [Candidatus Paceibacterota bacterium]
MSTDSETLVNSSSDRGDYLDLGYISPVDAPIKITSEIGRRWGRKHKGQDIDTEAGVVVRSCSPGNGQVIFVEPKDIGDFGKHVRVKIDGAVIIYAHLQEIADGITKGAIVEQGRPLGKVGSTGSVTPGLGGDGSHLHIEFTNTDPDFKTPIFGHKQRKT